MGVEVGFFPGLAMRRIAARRAAARASGAGTPAGSALPPRGVLELLAAAGTPSRLRSLDEEGLRAAMMARSRRLALTLPAQILAALDEQTVVVPACTDPLIPRCAVGR
jgi:hypothetical protein